MNKKRRNERKQEGMKENEAEMKEKERKRKKVLICQKN
jgi:hypothetical protein